MNWRADAASALATSQASLKHISSLFHQVRTRFQGRRQHYGSRRTVLDYQHQYRLQSRPETVGTLDNDSSTVMCFHDISKLDLLTWRWSSHYCCGACAYAISLLQCSVLCETFRYCRLHYANRQRLCHGRWFAKLW